LQHISNTLTKVAQNHQKKIQRSGGRRRGGRTWELLTLVKFDANGIARGPNVLLCVPNVLLCVPKMPTVSHAVLIVFQGKEEEKKKDLRATFMLLWRR
jgi:hypothetical protein